MKQTKLESLLERIIDALTGWLIALAVWSFIITPLWNIDVSPMSNIGITSIFTVVSIIRGYFWRRFFANELHKKIHKIIIKRT